ncbi:MAG: SMC-Scp complex subunit ScpB [Thaumarchaeota archaeon]|nr:SMC-Scp complex subunit ScpB [Candidatus Calditenuaceae archaeon]MDW8186901.1 SMC-Scp complex subunit ScpB [Nitrososphaerota archaeon]
MPRNRLNDVEARVVVEAILFAANRPVDLRTLMRATGWRSVREMTGLLRELKRDYDEQGRAFTLSELPSERFLMHVRHELLPIVRRYYRGSLLSSATLKTLSFIAYHQPIEMSAIAAVRGSRAYVQVRELEDLGLVDVERRGRKRILRTSQLFSTLIGVDGSGSRVKRLIEQALQQQGGAGQGDGGRKGAEPNL